MGFQEKNSPFTQEQGDLLDRLVPSLTQTQKIWLSGYLAASEETAATATLDTEEASGTDPSTQHDAEAPSRTVTVLFGSETGNCQALAEEMQQRLEAQSFNVTVSAMDDMKPNHVKKIENLLIITATHGEGDPPDNAQSFYEFLYSRKAPKLAGLRFSILALGDLSYEFYCQTGKDLDQRLEELGGERLSPRVDCDVDFDDPAEEWMAGVLEKIDETSDALTVAPGGETMTASQTKQSSYSRKHPFNAEVLENVKLTGRGSNKETRHLELSLEGSNLEFEPGDSLGIFPENDPLLVTQIIDEMGWDPDETVPMNKEGDVCTIQEALHYHFEITVLTKPLLEKAAAFSGNEQLKRMLEVGQEQQRKEYLEGRDVLDLVRDFSSWQATPLDFIQMLRKVPARLYSIASCYQANPDEVHLTVATVRYEAHGRQRTGVCSGQCAERIEPGNVLPVYVHRNPNFKFPADSATPVIMIGPGTGVAPYRSFLEEREETETQGKTWLFFGDQHFSTDFLYQVDWQKWLKEGILSRMDVAFSRDSEEKVYVQHRMLERSRDLYQWITEGANVYVCGDEAHMAHDVHDAFIRIFEQEGGMNCEEAESYLTAMRQQKRYQRDVY